MSDDRDRAEHDERVQSLNKQFAAIDRMFAPIMAKIRRRRVRIAVNNDKPEARGGDDAA